MRVSFLQHKYFFSTTTKNNSEKTQFGVILAPRKQIPRKLTFQNMSYQKPCACAKQDSIWGLVECPLTDIQMG